MQALQACSSTQPYRLKSLLSSPDWWIVWKLIFRAWEEFFFFLVLLVFILVKLCTQTKWNTLRIMQLDAEINLNLSSNPIPWEIKNSCSYLTNLCKTRNTDPETIQSQSILFTNPISPTLFFTLKVF